VKDKSSTTVSDPYRLLSPCTSIVVMAQSLTRPSER
jgi:hypothetical protein